MKRQSFIQHFAGIALGLILASDTFAQEAGRTYRLGLLALTESALAATREATLPELAQHGFVESRNLIVDPAIGDADALPRLARTLFSRNPDVVYAISQAAIRAAQQASADVPIAMFGDDPVQYGFAESLARPGRNITGVTILAAQLDAKRLHLLHEAIPSAHRIAALHVRGAPNRPDSEQAMRDVAASAGLELVGFDVGEPAEYAQTFAAMHNMNAHALVITANPQLYRDGSKLATLALEARLPTVCEWAEMARADCVLGYGPNLLEMRRHAGEYIARLLQGTRRARCQLRGRRISNSQLT